MINFANAILSIKRKAIIYLVKLLKLNYLRIAKRLV